MHKSNTMRRTLNAISALVLVFVSSSVLAHGGHSHAQHDMLSGLLHTLTTHPILWAGFGVALFVLMRTLRE